MGGGMQIPVVDVDGDGDLDLVCAGKSGLFLVENLTRAESANVTDLSLSQAVPPITAMITKLRRLRSIPSWYVFVRTVIVVFAMAS